MALDLPDPRRADIIVASYFPARSWVATNGDDLLWGELRSSPPALPYAPHVLGVRHTLEMSRIAAQRVAAQVINFIWLLTVGQSVTDGGSLSFPSRARARFSKRAVAFVRTCQPRPTFVWPAAVDFFPEAGRFVCVFSPGHMGGYSTSRNGRL